MGGAVRCRVGGMLQLLCVCCEGRNACPTPTDRPPVSTGLLERFVWE